MTIKATQLRAMAVYLGKKEEEGKIDMMIPFVNKSGCGCIAAHIGDKWGGVGEYHQWDYGVNILFDSLGLDRERFDEDTEIWDLGIVRDLFNKFTAIKQGDLFGEEEWGMPIRPVLEQLADAVESGELEEYAYTIWGI